MIGTLLLDWAREADAGPFSSLAVIDRLVYHNFDAFTTLAAAAGATRRIRLLTSVLLAPLYPPALLAKQLASLGALSDGRLTVGLGVGAREDDFTAVAAPFHRRGKHFEGQLEMMQRIWSGQPLGEGIGGIGPRSVQPGGPEIILGGVSPTALGRVGRWGNGYIAGTTGPERADKLFRLAEEAWQEAGRQGKPRLLACSYVALDPDTLERTRDSILHYYAFAGPGARMALENGSGRPSCHSGCPRTLSADRHRRVAPLHRDSCIGSTPASRRSGWLVITRLRLNGTELTCEV